MIKSKILSQIILILILIMITINNMCLISYAKYVFEYTIDVAEINLEGKISKNEL